MEDKVGSIVPSEKDVAALGDLVEQVSTKVAKWTIVLNSDQRARVVKPRTGFESIAVTIGNLVEKHGVVLPKISHPRDERGPHARRAASFPFGRP